MVIEMYTQLKVIGCKGNDPSIFDERFVRCNECPNVYNDSNCSACRTVNVSQLIFKWNIKEGEIDVYDWNR